MNLIDCGKYIGYLMMLGLVAKAYILSYLYLGVEIEGS